MPLDLTPDLLRALQDPQVGEALRQHLKPAVVEALAERDADVWLPARDAARYLYGRDAKEEAFRRLRERHPGLDRLSIGEGKLRRWKRADLDVFLASNPRISRRSATP